MDHCVISFFPSSGVAGNQPESGERGTEITMIFHLMLPGVGWPGKPFFTFFPDNFVFSSVT
jgi:hypothetical protein